MQGALQSSDGRGFLKSNGLIKPQGFAKHQRKGLRYLWQQKWHQRHLLLLIIDNTIKRNKFILKEPFFCRFSFCCFTIHPINFSLEQNISRLFRQAFIHCCELHQVWEQPSITVIIYVTRTLWAHALNSGHAQHDVWLPAVGYWLDWFELDHYCVCVIGF